MSSKKEDDMIEFLDGIEEAENVLKAKMAEFSEVEEELKTEKEIIQKEAQEGQKRLGNLDADWETVCGGIDAKMLATFNRIKANQKNKALKLLSHMQKIYDKEGMNPMSLAIIHAFLGNPGEAIVLLKKACEVRDPIIINFVNASNKDNKFFRLIPNCYEILESFGFKSNFNERYK